MGAEADATHMDVSCIVPEAYPARCRGIFLKITLFYI
jgi:hypothetical protein